MADKVIRKEEYECEYRGFTIDRVSIRRARRKKEMTEWKAYNSAEEELCRTETLDSARALVDRRVAGEPPKLGSLEKEEQLIVRVAYCGYTIERQASSNPRPWKSREKEWEARNSAGEELCRTETLRLACALVERSAAGQSLMLGELEEEERLIVRVAYRGYTIERIMEGLRYWIESKVDWGAYDLAGERLCRMKTLSSARALVDKAIAGEPPGFESPKEERFIFQVAYLGYVVERVEGGIYCDNPGGTGWEAYNPAGNQICGAETLQSAFAIVERDIAGELPPLASPEDELLIVRAAEEWDFVQAGERYRGEVERCPNGCDAGLAVVLLETLSWAELKVYCRACGASAAEMTAETMMKVEGLDKRTKLRDWRER